MPQQRRYGPCRAAARKTQWLRVAEHGDVDGHAQQRGQRVQRAAVRHHQHRRGLLQGRVERRALAGDELRERLAALGLAGPVDVGRRGADQRAEVALAQLGLRRGREPQRGRHRVGGVEGAARVAADDGADRLARQQLGRMRRLLQAELAQRFVDRLEDAQRVAPGLAVAQKVEVVAGRRERLRGGDLDQLVEAAGGGVGGACSVTWVGYLSMAQ
jgi:hypothetical protein